MVRRRPGRHDHRRAELRRGAGGQPGRRRRRTRCSSSPAPAISDLTGPKCNANTVHWTYDTWMLANGTGKAVVKTGGDTWFFLTADYAFGHALERDTAAVVEGQWRQGARQGPPSAQHLRTSRRSCCRRRRPRPRSSGSPMPAATPSTRSSRRAEFGIVKGGQKLRRPAGVRQRRRRARPADRAGPDADRDLLLGHERRQPRLDQALAGRSATPPASCRP